MQSGRQVQFDAFRFVRLATKTATNIELIRGMQQNLGTMHC